MSRRKMVEETVAKVADPEASDISHMLGVAIESVACGNVHEAVVEMELEGYRSIEIVVRSKQAVNKTKLNKKKYN